MPSFIIGTAGHVDHGKTTLIKALTGIDGDRLPQEKDRGLTIDLGFAHIMLPSGIICGIVDVPGHEKYLKNMLAGVGGYDFALLVIDVNEGVKEQTVEHLEIMELLGIRGGLAVITKIDGVEEDRVREVNDEVREFLRGTFMEEASILPVSATLGTGLEDLIRAVDRDISRLTPRDTEAPLRIPVDRVFSRPGFGTVITGTVYQGTVRSDRNVMVMPSVGKARVRQIQVHNRDQKEAFAGQRVALNLARIDWDKLSRGQQVVDPGIFKPTQSMDAVVKVLESSPHPLKNRDEVRFYLGTGEYFARVVLLDCEQVEPGGRGYARINLDSFTLALSRDRFIMRGPSSLYTLGGGMVLDPHPIYHRRFDRQAIELMKLWEMEDPVPLARHVLSSQPYRVFETELLAGAAAMPVRDAARIAGIMERQGLLHFISPGRFVLKEIMDSLREKVLGFLSIYEQHNPRSTGVRPQDIRMNLPQVEDRLFREILINLKGDGQIVEKSGFLTTAGHTPSLSGRHQECRQWIMRQFDDGGFTPPTRDDLLNDDSPYGEVVEEVLHYLTHQGELIYLDDRVLFTDDQLSRARKILGEHIYHHGPLTPSVARELLGSTRRYVIPLLEYFDRTYFTRRMKEGRVLFRKNILVE